MAVIIVSFINIIIFIFQDEFSRIADGIVDSIPKLNILKSYGKLHYYFFNFKQFRFSFNSFTFLYLNVV